MGTLNSIVLAITYELWSQTSMNVKPHRASLSLSQKQGLLGLPHIHKWSSRVGSVRGIGPHLTGATTPFPPNSALNSLDQCHLQGCGYRLSAHPGPSPWGLRILTGMFSQALDSKRPEGDPVPPPLYTEGACYTRWIVTLCWGSPCRNMQIPDQWDRKPMSQSLSFHWCLTPFH